MTTDPTALAERLRAGVSLIETLSREHRRCAVELGDDPDARAHRDTADNLDAILAALAPSAPGSGTGWRDISTAPKDGTPIIIHVPASTTKPVQEAWWAIDYEGAPGYWMTPVGPMGRGYAIRPEAPDMWQPLPSPPGAAEEDGR